MKRSLTILTVAPTIIFLLRSTTCTIVLVWVLTFIAMHEWTGMKRHLRVALLHPEPYLLEYPLPIPSNNIVVFSKCLLCSLIIWCAAYSPFAFHFATASYFLWWVLLTLIGRNREEIAAKTALKVKQSQTKSTDPACMLELRETEVIATRFTTDLFMKFCLEYFGFVWISGLGTAILLMQSRGTGWLFSLTVLISNWLNDIMALVVGRSLKGRTHPLYPRISPNKSLEGAVAGVIANALTMAAMLSYTSTPQDWHLSYPVFPVFFVAGLAFGILGVIGDLLESLFKRTALIKDTGNVFPGHGGVLDRVDGLLICYPVAYWGFTLWFNGMGQ